MVKATLGFYEKICDGDFNEHPSTYMVNGITKELVLDEIKDVLWQAIEIEGFDNSEVLVTVDFEKDGEYLDRDEFVMTAEIIRTSEPSNYVVWANKVPHIFKINREQSKISINAL